MRLACCCLALLFVSATWGYLPAAHRVVYSPGDSLLNKLQAVVGQYYDRIDKHSSMLFLRDEAGDALAELTKKNKAVTDSLVVANHFSLKNFCAKIGSEGEDKVREELKTTVDKIRKLEEEKARTDSEVLQKKLQLHVFDSILQAGRKDSAEIGARLAELTRDLGGAGVLQVGNTVYRFFIATRKQNEVHIYNSMSSPSTIEGIRQRLLDKKKDPLMITNAGMFTPEYKSQGLLVEDFKLFNGLDTTRPESKAKLNFYLQPNGVFLIDSGGFYDVLETQAYIQAYAGKKHAIRYATQSGPMLVSNGVINKNFRAASPNVNIRSGVGVLSNEKIVFVISDVPVNFYDFSVLFKEIFRCKNSLYLDGAISQMYINEKMLSKAKLAGSGTLGPMISVIKKD